MSSPSFFPFSLYSRDDKLSMANSIGGDWSLAPSIPGPKIFVIRGDYFNKVICEVSRELVWLRWLEIGQRNLPSRLSLTNLRVLELYEAYLPGLTKHHLEELWEAESDAPVQLRELVISECYKLHKFPNSIGRLNVLKKIVITECSSLTSLTEEFGRLQSLEYLQLHACEQLSFLPTSFGNLRNLRFLDLGWCTRLRMLPVSFKKLTLLQYLVLQFCNQLIIRPEDFQNITKLEYLNVSYCEQLEELPPQTTNQAFLRELYLNGGPSELVNGLRELPINIGQLSRLQKMSIGTEFLTSLPNSLGDLSSLKNLSICDCPRLESLPTSLGDLSSLTNLEICYCSNVQCFPLPLERLNLLEHLTICACPIKVDFGAAPLPFVSSKLKDVILSGTEVCRISMSADRYPRLESLDLQRNNQLTEIEALPTTVKSIKLAHCKMLKNIRVPCDLVNLESLKIESCPVLEELPSFARSTSLREFELIWGCYRIQKIEGLEYCTRLESLRVETCWEVPGIQSLERMEKLRTVGLRANNGSAIECCIQTIQKWPDEIAICTRAAPDASSVVDSLLSPNLVVDSFSNRKIRSRPKLNMHSSNGDELVMLCFVINCVTPQMRPVLLEDYGLFDLLPRVEKGRWVWLGVSQIHHFEVQIYGGEVQIYEEFDIEEESEEDGEEFKIEEEVEEDKEKIENQVERGLVVRGDEQTVVEAFRSLLSLLQSR